MTIIRIDPIENRDPGLAPGRALLAMTAILGITEMTTAESVAEKMTASITMPNDISLLRYVIASHPGFSLFLPCCVDRSTFFFATSDVRYLCPDPIW
jgi:hypothetical protein